MEKALFLVAGSLFCKLFYFVQQITHATSFRQLTYRQQLVEQLVGNIRNKCSKKRGRPSSLDLEERLNKQQHFIAKTAQGHNKKCMVCSKPQSRKTTLFYCETCVRKPRLHPGAYPEKLQTIKLFTAPYLCFHFLCFLTCILQSLSMSVVYIVCRIQIQNKKCN